MGIDLRIVRRVGWVVGFAAGAFLALAGPSVMANDSRLPDGTEHAAWERPTEFSKTYYVDGSSDKADDNGPGTSERPFKTINKAAQVLQPGERVVIASGVYRECVNPAKGGTGPDKMISYEAAPGAKVYIKGSDVLSDGWVQVTSTERGGARGAGGGATAPIWRHELAGAMFPNAYNPFALASVPGDWSWLNTKVVDMGPYFRRRGLVFVDGKPLEPMEQSRELGNTALISHIPTSRPAAVGRNGLPARDRGGAIMQEVGGSPDARFFVENPGNAIQIRVPASTPARPLIEITTREQAFVPLQRGLGYIRVKGITFQHAGNGYPPPQHGLVSTGGGNHWIIEGNTIEWANGVGLDLGNSDFSGNAPSVTGIQAGTQHIVRGNTIRYCGVEGIGGMGTQGTLIEDNLIEWIGWANAERGWEAAGAKFHSSRNLLVRRNVFRHIRHANAIWLDSGNSNCRITQNVFADVLTVSAAIHMEMNRNYNQIDNNIIWNVRNSEPGTPGQRGSAGSGIFCHATDRLIISQNIFGKCDNAGVFPVLRPERNGAGVGQENAIYNNIFTSCGNSAIVFLSPRNEANGNVFAAMPEKCLTFVEDEKSQAMDLKAWREKGGWDKNSLMSGMKLDFDADKLELTIGGEVDLLKVNAFNKIDHDMLGKAIGETTTPGPLAEMLKGVKAVDPRKEVKK